MFIWWQRYVLRDEAGEGGEMGGGAAGAGAADAGAAAGGDAGAAAESGAPAGEQDKTKAGGDGAPADMLGAIDQALGYAKKPDAGEGKPAGEKGSAAPAKPAGDPKAEAAAARKALEEKAAAGDAQAKKDLEALQAKEKADADPTKKDLAKLGLNDADKKTMSSRTQARFTEVLEIAKAERTARERAEAQVKPLQQAWQGMMGALKETNTSDEDLAQLLEYNRLAKSGTAADLQGALQIVNTQRAAIMKALGMPADGKDPLEAHPDLAAEVDEQKITRQRALEIAETRRKEALSKRDTDASAARAKAKADAQRQELEAIGAAQKDIAAWTAHLEKTDLDYKAKEANVIAQVDAVIKDYPPHLWLPTLKRLYAATKVTKEQPALPANGEQPLRPSSAKPGSKAPGSMEEAIDQGLGYSQ